MRTTLFTILLTVGALQPVQPAKAEEDPIQVFILAGQSNMVGYGWVEGGRFATLRSMVNRDTETFGHGGTNPLVDVEGNWIVRDDVNVYAHNDNRDDDPILKISGHTPGLGAWSAPRRDFIGPEYGFGQVIGNAMDEDVLIIKIADGGTTLNEDWRSPTAVEKRGGDVGRMWNVLNTEVDQVIENLSQHFPEYEGRTTEIAGFGWHQGWNDGDGTRAPNYEANLADLIRDVRTEYGEDLPFVIANTGIGGYEQENANRLQVIASQNAMADATKYPDFVGNVAVVETRGMHISDEDLLPTNRQGFHWNNSAVTYYQIGEGMGEAYLSLIPEPSSMMILGAAGSLLASRPRR